MHIIAGDFNAELGVGIGVERLSVGQHTVDDVKETCGPQHNWQKNSSKTTHTQNSERLRETVGLHPGEETAQAIQMCYGTIRNSSARQSMPPTPGQETKEARRSERWHKTNDGGYETWRKFLVWRAAPSARKRNQNKKDSQQQAKSMQTRTRLAWKWANMQHLRAKNASLKRRQLLDVLKVISEAKQQRQQQQGQNRDKMKQHRLQPKTNMKTKWRTWQKMQRA